MILLLKLNIIRLVVLITLLLGSQVSAAETDPAIVDLIADDLEGLVGDTVNEGSWEAAILRDHMTCEIITVQSSKRYQCQIKFLVTPYESEDIDSDPWEVTCTDVQYKFTSRRGRTKPRVEAIQSTTSSCVEVLSEGPF